MANPPLTRSKTRRFYARYVGCGRESGCWSRGETRSSGDGGRDAIALDPLQAAGVRRRQWRRRRLPALAGDRLLARFPGREHAIRLLDVVTGADVHAVDAAWTANGRVLA